MLNGDWRFMRLVCNRSTAHIWGTGDVTSLTTGSDPVSSPWPTVARLKPLFLCIPPSSGTGLGFVECLFLTSFFSYVLVEYRSTRVLRIYPSRVLETLATYTD